MVRVAQEEDDRTLPWHYAHDPELTRLQSKGVVLRSGQVNSVVGLDWEVYQTPAYHYVGNQPELDKSGYVRDEHGVYVENFRLVGDSEPEYWLNVRSDTHRVVGIVKDRYTVFQNSVAPVFLDSLADKGRLEYIAAGELFDGSQVWWLARLAETVAVAGDERERLETYLHLTNSHDGSTPVMVSTFTVRVAGPNTLSWSFPSLKRQRKIRHTPGAPAKRSEATRSRNLGLAYQSKIAETADQMLHTPLSEGEFQAFLNTLLPTPEPTGRNQRGITYADGVKAQIRHIYHNSKTQRWLEGTLWGAVQATQFYADHFAESRNTARSTPEQNRFMRLVEGRTLGADAFSDALSLLKP